MNSRTCPDRHFLVLIVVMASILVPAWNESAATTFSVAQLTTGTEDAADASIAADAAGEVHVAYEAGENIYYTSSYDWIQTRINGSESGQRPSIALDSSGNAIVVYFDAEGSVWEASNASGAWQRTDTGFDTDAFFGSASVLVAADGTPHVVLAAPGASSDNIVHLVRSGSSWQEEAVTDNGLGELNPSMAFDASSDLHVAFQRRANYFDIVYATNAGGTWEETPLTADPDSDQHLASVAVDSGGGVHVVYTQRNLGLFHATNRGAYWQHELMETAGTAIRAAVVVDALGVVHVVYQDNAGGGVVRYTNNAGGTWADGQSLDELIGDQWLTWVDRPVVLDSAGYLNVVFSGTVQGVYQVFHARSDEPVVEAGSGGTCAAPLPLACGASVTGDTSTFTNNIDFYSCSLWEESAPEVVYSFELAYGAVYDVTAEVASPALDLDVYLLDAAGCGSGTCIAGTSVTNISASAARVPAGTYYVAVDGSVSQRGAYTLDLDCAPVELGCTPSDTTLCLNDSRFRVSARYRSQGEEEKAAEAVAMTSDTGYFWFFNRNNVEIVVKVLGCVNGSYWVFAAGLTNVEVTLRVEDTQTGQYREYLNPLGQAFQPLQDTNAFEGCK